MTGARKPDEAELRARLTDEQYRVTQEKGTECAFTGGLLHNKESGVYACVVCGSELFESTAKYDSGYPAGRHSGSRWRATAWGRTSIAVTAWSARK